MFKRFKDKYFCTNHKSQSKVHSMKVDFYPIDAFYSHAFFSQLNTIMQKEKSFRSTYIRLGPGKGNLSHCWSL